MVPKTSTRVPSYCLHRATGQAIVRLDGRDFYLGPYGSPESRAKYERLIAEWLRNGRTIAPPSAATIYTVGHLVRDYLAHCRRTYVDAEGRFSPSVANTEQALRRLACLFFDVPVVEFGPKSLALYRQRLIDGEPQEPRVDENGEKRRPRKPLARGTVNDRAYAVKRCFKWGVAEEKVPPSVFHGLQAVSGLRRGRCGVREGEGVRPVPERDLEKTLPHLSETVRALVKLQLVSGMRPGEVVLVRPVDIDRSGRVWLYRPTHHKVEWRGLERTVPFGPRAQEILSPFLLRPAESFAFAPSETEHRRRRALRVARRTPLWPSHIRRYESKRRAHPKREPRDRYTVQSFGRAIRRACIRAQVEPWSPGQLRHNAATRLRREFGLEAAAAILGHRLLETTQVYAEVNAERALEIAAQVG